MTTARTVARFALLWGVLGFVATGCNTAPPKPPLMANNVKDEMTAYQLRSIDYEYASRFAQLVAACAGEIAVSTGDPGARYDADRWRLWASPQARAAAFDQDPFAGLGSIEETLRDINDRLTILTVQMPVESRWQAEYLVQSLLDDRIAKPTASVVGAMKNLTGLLADFGQTLGNHISSLLDVVEMERSALIEAVQDERRAVLGAIEIERVTILDDLDLKLQNATDELDSVGRGLIDHFFKRLIQVLIGMGLFVLLVVALVLFFVRGRRDHED